MVEDSRWKVDVYMYNLVLDALAKAGYLGKMDEILQDMAQSRVDKDRVTYSVLYGAYSSRGDDARADQVWQEMKDRGVEMDLAGYNGLMNTFARRDDVDRVLETYKQMQAASIEPDQGTFSILLECCARDALEFRTRTSAAAAAATETKKAGDKEGEAEKTGEEEDDDDLYAMDEKERVRILQSKRRRMEAVMRAMKKTKVPLDSILINSIIRCYASLGEVEEMFSVVRFLVEEENIKLAEVSVTHNTHDTHDTTRYRRTNCGVRVAGQLLADDLLRREGEGDRCGASHESPRGDEVEECPAHGQDHQRRHPLVRLCRPAAARGLHPPALRTDHQR